MIRRKHRTAEPTELVGRQIKLTKLGPTPAPVKIGSEGKILSTISVAGGSVVTVEWESGRVTTLLIPFDSYEFID